MFNKRLWLYTTDFRLRTDEHLCLSNVQLQYQSRTWQIQLKECAGNPNEYWDYESGKLRNRESGLCLTLPTIFDNSKDELNPPIVEKCARFGDEFEKQQWIFRDVKWLKL
ncbi:unnamed protein product [Caenorhabditis angaria]|uniref:Ricin B lectin domain-containing protein n=1 Tax=Caenorhabditis angaria TaxID=860376 RepID=A0A9P1N2Q3_9PELO|nr:unnamed protein product [Caenorhabditis angaria]